MYYAIVDTQTGDTVSAPAPMSKRLMAICARMNEDTPHRFQIREVPESNYTEHDKPAIKDPKQGKLF